MPSIKNLQDFATRRILVAPLDWGLGHATRCIPLIVSLRKMKSEVILAGSGASLWLLRHTFPDLQSLELPAYEVQYGQRGLMWALLKQAPHLFQTIRKEHRQVETWVAEQGIEGIISDNRYGVWSRAIPSVFLGHQLAILPPKGWTWARRLVYHLHLHSLRHFSELWVPDAPPDHPSALTGTLTQAYPLPKNVYFLGPLSRFTVLSDLPPASTLLSDVELDHLSTAFPPQIICVLSGPEPQRSLLEDQLVEQLQRLPYRTWVIQGKPEHKLLTHVENVWKIPHLPSSRLAAALKTADVVVSRSGYSSLMDYAALGLRRLILIPTPAQTEQEYLAQTLAQQNRAICQVQDHIHLSQALEDVKKTIGFDSGFQGTSRTNVLARWIARLPKGH